MVDVAVLGAGLAGLSAARDLKRAGADVLLVEARDRPGGRVEVVTLPDGRTVQAGGEVFGPGHTAYGELVEELGLTVEPSYVADPGEISWGLVDGVHVGDDVPWMTELERLDDERIGKAFVALAATVDPDDPWSHPDAGALDAAEPRRVAPRARRALPAVSRRHELASFSLACDSPERTSLLAELRKHAALGGEGFYDLDRWESLRVSEGSAAVALAMAAELGPDAIRFESVVRRVEVRRGAVDVTLSRRRRGDRRRGGRVRDPRRARCGRSRSPASATPGCALSSRTATRWRPKSSRRTRPRSGRSAARTGSPSANGCSARPGPRAPACCRCWSRPSVYRRSWRRPRRSASSTVVDGLVALYGERARFPAGDARARVGRRPVHAGLHLELGAR